MKDRIYRILVNRVPGIRERYLEKRNQKKGMGRLGALFTLLWLNVQYYLLFRKSLGQSKQFPVYEEKPLWHKGSESSLSRRESPEAFASRLMQYDIVSFDVFDTLLFRPFSSPADIFFLVGMELCYPDFKRLRIEAEERAREKKEKSDKTREVTLEEIWNELEAETGISKEAGMRAEWEWERKCCFANPYLLRVVKELQKKGKRVIAVSDMYLGPEHIRKLLQDCGYGTFCGYFVSGSLGVSKSDGRLYDLIRRQMGEGCSYAHVGDQEHSDQKQAGQHGWEAFLYHNVNQTGGRFRPQDMSAVTGSIYRGLVNARLHSGEAVYSREYEYGFAYGGLFAAGYCRFLHEYAQSHQIDKIVFLSRDGAVLLEAYRLMYPMEQERITYGYWSRLAAMKLTCGYFREEYFQRFLFHKADQGFSFRQILESMELGFMLVPLCRSVQAKPETELTHKNAEDVKKYIIDHWEQVLAQYEEQRTAGGMYYRQLLQNCKKVAAVDVGWAGSGAIMLRYAVSHLWNMECEVTGILAGTNTCQSAGRDASEAFYLDGKLASYLYSQQVNRDLWKFHDPTKGHNLYWELLLGAPEGSLRGFYLDGSGQCQLRFRKNHADAAKIDEIHRGILDFVRLFLETERRLGIAIPVSGRDAYAPMLCVEGRKNQKFRKGLEGLLDEIHIG